MKKYIPSIIVSLLSIVTLIGCGGRQTNTETRTEDPSLDFHRWQDSAKIVNLGNSRDTVFIGFYMGMKKKDAEKHLNRMISAEKLYGTGVWFTGHYSIEDCSSALFSNNPVYHMYFEDNKEAVFMVFMEFEQDSLYKVELREADYYSTKEGERISGIELGDSLVSKFGKLYISKGYSSFKINGDSTTKLYYYQWNSNTSIILSTSASSNSNTIEFKDLFLENKLNEAEKRAKEASYNNAMNDSKGDF